MKKSLSYGCVLVMSVIAFYETSAQADSVKNIGFKLGAFYNTDLNYFGRTDSLQSSGFFPLAELWFIQSFYVNAAPVFINNASSSMEYAGTVTTAGFQDISKNKKWFGNVFAAKPFYKSNSHLIQSALKAQAGFSVTNLSKIINVTIGSDMKVSRKVDFGITGGLDHIFKKQCSNHSMLIIDPSIYLFAGTQQFATSYPDKNGSFLFPPLEQLASEEVKKFNVLSYEFSAPVIFSKEKFQLLCTPAYVIPQNLITVQGRPDLSERGSKRFYATIGAKLIL